MTRENELKTALRGLVDNVNKQIGYLDEAMKGKESPERGKRIALIANNLDMAIDSVMHSTFGMTFNGIKKWKQRSGRDMK